MTITKTSSKKFLGIIVARGGSKGIKNKNFTKFFNKPLIYWTISEAKKSKYLNHIILSTDSKKIANFGKKYNLNVPFLRPPHLSNDKAKAVDVVLHAISFLEKKGNFFDYVALLEPTSPLRDSNDIDNSIKKILKLKGTSLISVSKCKASHTNFQFKKVSQILKPINNKNKLKSSRQELKDIFFIDGSIYISKVSHILNKKEFYSKKMISYEVPSWKSIEIDSQTDLVIAECIKKNLHRFKRYDSKIFD